MTARRIAAVAAGLVLVFDGGYAAHGDRQGPPAAAPPVASETYPATADGAARAAADHRRLLGDQCLFDATAREPLLDNAVTPTLRPDVETSVRAAADRLGAQRDAVSRIGVLGTHVEAYEADRAALTATWRRPGALT